jgi:ABC-type transport system involved in multi-copper enzyme maturation permease subunit
MYLYIGLSILTVLTLLCLLSKQIRNQFKFLFLPFLILSGICITYYVITGNSPTHIPGDINNYFSNPHVQNEMSHQYYQNPEERYGDQTD